MKRLTYSALLLFLAAACGTGAKHQRPSQNVRSDAYALVFSASRAAQPGIVLQIFSDSITTVLDSVVLHGIDETYSMWQKLATNAMLTTTNRTILSTETFGDTALRDRGRIVFSRTAMKDTTMTFSSMWHREKAGWRIVVDSVRAGR